MNLESLHYADAVVDVGSFSAVANKYGLTPRAVSRSIARLENHLGQDLFLRTSRGAVLTAFGTAVLPRISEFIELLDDVEAEAEKLSVDNASTVRIGISSQLSSGKVAELRDAVHGPGALEPGKDLTLLEAELDPLQKSLQLDELDMLIIPAVGILPDYSHRLIDSDHLVLVGQPIDDSSVPVFGESSLTVEQISRCGLILSGDGCGITKIVEDLLEEEGYVPAVSELGVSNCSTLPGWVGKGMGAVILPEHKVPPRMSARRILREDGTFVEVFYEAVWNPDATEVAYLESLLERLDSLTSSWSGSHRTD